MAPSPTAVIKVSLHANKSVFLSIQMNGKGAKEAERDSKLSISPSPSSASSNASLVTPPTNTPPEVRDGTVALVRKVLIS